MRIKQCHSVLGFFKPHVFKKYGFTEYTNPNAPAIFWGLYPRSSRKLLAHKAPAIVVWRGSDALRMVNDKIYIKWLRGAKHVYHVAISSFIEQDLMRMGLPYKSIPLTSMDCSDIPFMPRGEGIYVYDAKSGKALTPYNLHVANEVCRQTGFPMRLCHKDSYPRFRLINEIYRECFIGLRIIDHDGLSNTVVEMGLAGRMVVYNGATPNAMPYRDVQDIVEIVQKAYALRDEDNRQIRQDMLEFISVPDTWMNLEFWKE